MKCSWHECLIPFSDGSENYEVGDKVLVLPGLCNKTHFCVGTDMHVPVMVERKYISNEGTVSYTGEKITV